MSSYVTNTPDVPDPIDHFKDIDKQLADSGLKPLSYYNAPTKSRDRAVPADLAIEIEISDDLASASPPNLTFKPLPNSTQPFPTKPSNMHQNAAGWWVEDDAAWSASDYLFSS